MKAQNDREAKSLDELFEQKQQYVSSILMCNPPGGGGQLSELSFVGIDPLFHILCVAVTHLFHALLYLLVHISVGEIHLSLSCLLMRKSEKNWSNA